MVASRGGCETLGVERLFETEEAPRGRTSVPPSDQPLAVRMRPTTLAEFIGQEHLLGDGSALRTALEEGRPHSMILYGPPGTGKTRLARLLALNSRAAFEVNSALLSRCTVYEFRQLEEAHVLALLRRALSDERGLTEAPRVDDEALEFLAARAGGDARTALAALEVACETAGGDTITLRHAEDALQRKALLYDKGGDRHYDTISAWIKSTRGSDPDASMLYLVEMLEGGEDPRFIARRMVVLASEDIGNADPRALEVAVAAAHAVEHVGMPECAFNLAQAAIYLSLAPKSDTVKRALGRTAAWIAENGATEPPGS